MLTFLFPIRMHTMYAYHTYTLRTFVELEVLVNFLTSYHWQKILFKLALEKQPGPHIQLSSIQVSGITLVKWCLNKNFKKMQAVLQLVEDTDRCV